MQVSLTDRIDRIDPFQRSGQVGSDLKRIERIVPIDRIPSMTLKVIEMK